MLAVALFSANIPIDLASHDTYFIVPVTLLIWLPAIISILFWVLYLLTNRFLFSKALTWIHIVLTIICSILILALPFLLTYSIVDLDAPRRYNDYDGSNRFKFFGSLVSITSIMILILLFGQVTYFVNLIIGLAKKLQG